MGMAHEGGACVRRGLVCVSYRWGSECLSDNLLLNMEAGSARIVESAIYDDHLFFFRLLACTRFRIVTPRPSTSRKKCRLGSKFTVRALLCAPSVGFRFRLSYFKRPSERSFARANSASFRSKTDRRNPKCRTCSVFAILPSQEITTRRNYNATSAKERCSAPCHCSTR